MQRRDIIDVLPTLESPTNITLKAQVGKLGLSFSSPPTVFSEVNQKNKVQLIINLESKFIWKWLETNSLIFADLIPCVPIIGGCSSHWASAVKDSRRSRLKFTIFVLDKTSVLENGADDLVLFASSNSSARFSEKIDFFEY